MKIECTKDNLKEVVLKSNRISGKRLSLQILNNIFLKTEDNSLLVKSTNLELGIEITIPVKTYSEGEVVVSGEVLRTLLENLKEETVIIEHKKDSLEVSTKKTKTLIKTYPDTDFPTIPVVSSKNDTVLSSKNLLGGLQSVWYSATTLNMKPELSSVYINTDNGYMYFVATDSFRLAEKKIEVKKDICVNEVLIPIKNIPEIMKILEEMEREITLSVDKNQISFSDTHTYLTSRLIEGNFPDYRQIIPKESLTQLIVLKNDLANSFNLSQFFSDKFHQVHIDVFKKEKKFKISTKNIDIGENVQYVDATISGEDISLNFNYKYMQECLQSINGDSVSLELSGVGKPVVMRGCSDKTFFYLVMPMSK